MAEVVVVKESIGSISWQTEHTRTPHCSCEAAELEQRGRLASRARYPHKLASRAASLRGPQPTRYRRKLRREMSDPGSLGWRTRRATRPLIEISAEMAPCRGASARDNSDAVASRVQAAHRLMSVNAAAQHRNAAGQHRPTANPLRKSHHERSQTLRRTSGNMF